MYNFQNYIIYLTKIIFFNKEINFLDTTFAGNTILKIKI